MNALPPRDVRHVSLLWATPEHATDMARLHSAVFNPGWDAPSIMKLLEHPGATSFVATTGFPKVMVGFILGQLAADEAEILSIGVIPEWQRVGLGARLVDGLSKAAQKAQAKRLFLEVAVDNPAAQALYAKLGFAEVGRRKGYYQRPNAAAVDAVVLAKSI